MPAGYAQAAQSFNQPMSEPPVVSTVHNTAGQVAARIASANQVLLNILSRIRGAQPQSISNQNDAKLVSEPSVLAHLVSANSELCTLESLISELSEHIG